MAIAFILLRKEFSTTVHVTVVVRPLPFTVPPSAPSSNSLHDRYATSWASHAPEAKNLQGRTLQRPGGKRALAAAVVVVLQLQEQQEPVAAIGEGVPVTSVAQEAHRSHAL